jgi:hypothetical protein
MTIFFLVSSGLGMLGNSMALYAFVVIVLGQSGSPFLGALVYAAVEMSQVVATFWAGVAADGHRRYALTLRSTIANTVVLALAAAAFSGLGGIVPLFLAAPLFGMAMAFLMTSRLALLRNLIEGSRFEAAMTKFSVIQIIASGSGPVVVGTARQLLSWEETLALTALLLVLAVGFLLLLRSTSDSYGGDVAVVTAGGLERLHDGLHHVRQRPVTWQLLLLLALTSFLIIGPYSVVGPDLASRVLGLGEFDRGVMLGSLALGLLLGGIVALRMLHLVHRGMVLSAATVASGVSLAFFSQSGSFVEGTLWAIAIGFNGAIAWGLGSTSLQTSIDSAYAGRVMGLYIAVQPAFASLGAATFGWAADVYGPASSLAVAGIVASAGTLLHLAAFAPYRRLGPSRVAAP